ncbi:uncharacterized protein mi [Halyomorpha halys]|uniref:uncharacterized protein mi n=1 Tax=Halyomorpha halys TaxID=286706 RepID=UPI0006D4F7A1|nr:uncharacterized protein LOC106692967 [Halyomorpha halys]
MEGYVSDEDIFADEASCSKVVLSSPKTPIHKESAEVSRLKAMMGGIPPPPEMTNPAIDMSAMLSSWYTNKHLWWDGSLTSADNVQNKFDVYLNNDCEEVEALRMKIAERRISSETSSSFVMHEVLTSSAKKRQKRNGWAKSPGSRLSYLAKRRNTFCKRTNDLSKARTISIIKDDKKKYSQGGQLYLKRALFQSPDNSDFTTPIPSSKRPRLMSFNDRSQSPIIPKETFGNTDSKLRTCTRNLESEFDKFKCEKILNPRQKQLWSRAPLAAITTKLKIL